MDSIQTSKQGQLLLHTSVTYIISPSLNITSNWLASLRNLSYLKFALCTFNLTSNLTITLTAKMVTLAHFMQHPHSSNAYCPLSQQEGGSGHCKYLLLLLYFFITSNCCLGRASKNGYFTVRLIVRGGQPTRPWLEANVNILTYLLYSGPILTTFWLQSDYILTTFCLHSAYILTAFWPHSD